jgi:tRNA (guanine37-N1)-methyltransferase
MKSVDRKRRIREYYSRRSENYDRQKSRTWKSSQGFGDDVFSELLTAMTGFGNKLLLEVGVGTGRNALPLLEKIKPQFIGLDLSREMLEHAKTKMSTFKDRLELILADGENLPFANHAFDAIMCMSTMHYFESQEKILRQLRDVLKPNGTFLYGDLTVHEKDNQEFFETLERTVSKVHAKYCKPSQIRALIEKQGFQISTIKTFPYRKTHSALMEDKGRYFGVASQTLQECVEEATEEAREQYALTRTEITLFYTIINAKNEESPHETVEKRSVCIKTPKREGEKTLNLTLKLGLINNDLEIQRDEKHIFIPLKKSPSTEELKILKKKIVEFEVSVHSFPQRRRPKKSLAQLLEDSIPPHLLISLPRAIDFVGDIAIVEIPPELDAYKLAIGNTVLQMNQKSRTVLAKAGAVGGIYRLRKFTVIAGEPKTETVHREYGCQYYVDVAKAFFSPRLSFEHHRVASLVQNGETVVDLFAGVGPFSVQIAKNHRNVKVYAVDVNPKAVEYLKKNIRVNRVTGMVHPIVGDARQVVTNKLSGVADRVIMNLPEKAIQFVDVACEALKPSGGTIHFYSFISQSDSLDRLKPRFTESVEKSGRSVAKILFSRLVRETAPNEWQVVLDARIRWEPTL